MPRRKKQTDIEDAINGNGSAKPGHNGASTLTDEERRALTLHHRGLYAAADAMVEKAKADRKSVADQARADLGKGAVNDIKDLIKASDPEIAKAGIERALRLARWLGLPIGTQMQMFDAPVDDRARNDGLTAGMEGKVCDPPRHFAVTEHQVWIQGWHAGQEILASAFKKLKPDEAPPTAPTHQEAAPAAQ